jgi:hypothetical protein
LLKIARMPGNGSATSGVHDPPRNIYLLVPPI